MPRASPRKRTEDGELSNNKLHSGCCTTSRKRTHFRPSFSRFRSPPTMSSASNDLNDAINDLTDVRTIVQIQEEDDSRVERRREPGSTRFMRLYLDNRQTKFVQCIGCHMTLSMPGKMPVHELESHICVKVVKSDAGDASRVHTAYRVDWVNGKSVSGMSLMVDGCSFQRHHKNGDIQSWRCSKYYPDKCMSKAYTTGQWLHKPITCAHIHEHGDMNPANQSFVTNSGPIGIPEIAEPIVDHIDTENMEPSFDNFDEEDDTGIHEIEWLPSRNGSNRLTLCIDGHNFHRDVDKNGLQTWKCSKHRSHKCKVRTATRDSQLVKPVSGLHTHGCDPRDAARRNSAKVLETTAEEGSDFETPGFEVVLSEEEDSNGSPDAITMANGFQYPPNSEHSYNYSKQQLNGLGTSILAKSGPNAPLDLPMPPKYAGILNERDQEIMKLKQDNERLRGELTLKNAAINKHDNQMNELRKEKERELESLKRLLGDNLGNGSSDGVIGPNGKRVCSEKDVELRSKDKELSQIRMEVNKMKLEIAHLKGQVEEGDKWKSIFQSKTITMT